MAPGDLDPGSFADAVTRRERQLRQVAVAGLASVVAAVVVGVGFRLPQAVFVTGAGVLGLLVLGARFFLWRCPACGAQLSGRSGSRACPGCDRPLPESPA